jgi:hypothetical protein
MASIILDTDDRTHEMTMTMTMTAFATAFEIPATMIRFAIDLRDGKTAHT